MVIVCAWCLDTLEEPLPAAALPAGPPTHGICARCLRQIENRIALAAISPSESGDESV